jgi:hypothetical protein
MKWNEIDNIQREQIISCFISILRECDRLYKDACANNLYTQSEFLLKQVQGINCALEVLGYDPIERKWKESK